MLIKTEQSEIQNYLVDAANYKGKCEAVYFPESIEDIVEIIKKANREKLHVTVSGNGTGLTGGRVPDDGIVISTERLNRIIEINNNKKYAIVEPGVLLSDFQKELEKLGLYYPPDPTEKDCFIGGTVANNSSGAKSFKYGSTRNFVEEIKIILPIGEVISIKRNQNKFIDGICTLNYNSNDQLKIELPSYSISNTKFAAGYYVKDEMDLIDLFIGSEGTLGVICEIKLRLLDKPSNILSSVVFFNDEYDALNFISSARKTSFQNRKNNIKELDALGLEFFDGNTLKFLTEDYPNIPEQAKAAVWFEQEFNSGNEDIIFNQWTNLIELNNADFETAWFAANDSDRKKFGEFRHSVAWKVNDYISRKNILKVGTDVAVPHENFMELYSYSKNLVSESKLNFISYGHFGDSHLHLNMLPQNEGEYQTAKNNYMKICQKAVDLNGTISAEHGIGKLKRDYLLIMFGEKSIKEMAKLKKQFDPNLILNIGNIIDPKFYESI